MKDVEDEGAQKKKPKKKKKKNQKKRDLLASGSESEAEERWQPPPKVEEAPIALTEVEEAEKLGKKGKLGQLSMQEKDFEAQEYLNKKASKKKPKKNKKKLIDQESDLPFGEAPSEKFLAGLEPKEVVEDEDEEWKEYKFKCAKCKWGADGNEGFKEHYKSGWHRHNLKLLVNESDAITYETYQELELMLQLETNK